MSGLKHVKRGGGKGLRVDFFIEKVHWINSEYARGYLLARSDEKEKLAKNSAVQALVEKALSNKDDWNETKSTQGLKSYPVPGRGVTIYIKKISEEEFKAGPKSAAKKKPEPQPTPAPEPKPENGLSDEEIAAIESETGIGD